VDYTGGCFEKWGDKDKGKGKKDKKIYRKRKGHLKIYDKYYVV
jgi:hypothetical protein